MQKIIICILFLCLSLTSGCVPFERRLAVRKLSQQMYFFDFSTQDPQGTLVVQCSPPSTQYGTSDYVIMIDDSVPVQIYKYSQSTFMLDEGAHTIEIYALSNSGNQLGKKTVYEIKIIDGAVLQYEYIGPYWMWSSGSLREIILDAQNVSR